MKKKKKFWQPEHIKANVILINMARQDFTTKLRLRSIEWKGLHITIVLFCNFTNKNFILEINCIGNTAVGTMYLRQWLMEKQQDSELMRQQRWDEPRGELVQTAALIKITSVSDGPAKEQGKCT